MPKSQDILGAMMRNEYYMATAAPLAQARLSQAIDELERRIIKEVSALKTTGTKLLGPKVNLKQAQQIQKSLTKIFAETYGDQARKEVVGFKKAATYINNNWAELNEAMAFADVDKPMIDTLGTQYYNEFSKFGKSAQSTIETAMYNSIAGQQSHSELVNSISAALTGKYSKAGVPMSRYAEQFAFDGMMNFSQAVNLAKAEAGGFDKYLYYGNVMTTTRHFCRHRVGTVFTKKEIDSWTDSWRGKAGPAFTHRGGYNCRHHWQPVMGEWVDNGQKNYFKARTPNAMKTYFMAMDYLAQYGVKQGSKGAKFVEALIAQPMTNAEIKALPWNTVGNLHGDIFKKLKDKGLAGVGPGGKKWIKAPAEAALVDVSGYAGPKPTPPPTSSTAKKVAAANAKDVPEDITDIGIAQADKATIEYTLEELYDDLTYSADGSYGGHTHILNNNDIPVMSIPDEGIWPDLYDDHGITKKEWEEAAALFNNMSFNEQKKYYKVQNIWTYDINSTGEHMYLDYEKVKDLVLEGGGHDLPKVFLWDKDVGDYLLLTEKDEYIASAAKYLKDNSPGAEKIDVLHVDMKKLVNDMKGTSKAAKKAALKAAKEDLGNLDELEALVSADLDEEIEEAVNKKALEKLKKKSAAEAISSTPEDFGFDSKTLKGKFVQSLIDEPMTNAEIKALDWNASGNLHNDAFKKLKDQGYAGVYKGKKWVSLSGQPPASLIGDTAESVVQEAAPKLAAGPKKAGKVKIVEHFDNVKSRGYGASDEKYFKDISNAHISELYANNSQLDKLMQGKPKLGGLRLENGTELGGGYGKVGKYDGYKRTISIAGENSKEHTLAYGQYNVSSDYYGILRHEYGHHVWDTHNGHEMLQDWHDLSDYFANSKGVTYYKQVISKYADTVEDSFAEAFSAYTSPLYKRGGLPKHIENYFDHWLNGKKKTYTSIWKVKAKPTAAPAKGKLFRTKEHNDQYKAFLKSYEDEIQKEIDRVGGSMSPKGLSRWIRRNLYYRDIEGTWIDASARSWQGDTHNNPARLIKFKAEQIENRPIKTRITRMTRSTISRLWSEAERSDTRTYLKMKALTRAYYNKIGVNKVKLYRGIGGDHGRAYAQKVHDLKKQHGRNSLKKFLIEEDSMVGYSENWETAEDFGAIIITRQVDVNDILMSDKVWKKRGFFDEEEYIMIGGKYNVPLKDISVERLW